ncbi:MAG: transcription termination/antitermination protein NusG [Alphaproteobacteria bacterium]
MSARWYVVHVHSGCEKKVSASITEQAELKGLSEQILEIMIPTEEVVEIKKGQKVSSERKFFPGYILVKMVMSDEAWSLIKNTHKVTNFLGNRNKPLPISEREAQKIISQIQEGVERPQTIITFEIGEQVKVADGPFASFVGLVEEIDTEKSRLKVSVSIFGRATPVDLDFSQVERA